MLNCRRLELLANVPQNAFPLITVVSRDADLDQLVAFEVDVDFLQHCAAQPFVADHHDRGEAMRARLELFTLSSRQLHEVARSLQKVGRPGDCRQ